MSRILLLLLVQCLLFAQSAFPQQGRVVDAVTGEGLPFATIKSTTGKEGLITDLNGNFKLPTSVQWQELEVSYLGYQTQRLSLTGKDNLVIKLHPQGSELGEVSFTPPYEKIRRILNQVIAHRDHNNPDKYDWYRCNIYHKMVVDIKPHDSLLHHDTSGDTRELVEFTEKQHVLLSETFSRRTWSQPQKLQEEVIASRLSGFKKSLFTSLVTDVLPFHSYSDFLLLNGKDYHNPVSKGYRQRYDFNLVDELEKGSDTLWVLSFRPKTNSAELLKGTLYINSSNYAIASLLATAYDPDLKRTIRIEQEYQQLGERWFPRELNYIIELVPPVESESGFKGDELSIIMKGNSKIDSIVFERDPRFRFNKRHTVRLMPGADERDVRLWDSVRTVRLSTKEERTYEFNDSLGTALKVDRFVPYLEKLVEAKFPVGPLDLQLKRIYSYNKYEGSRLGLGLQTNEKISKWFSIGGWGGYGIKDKEWKYGGFAEIYADRYKEFVVRVSYDKDLRDPGRVQLHPELDVNYLRQFLLYRVDEVERISLGTEAKAGYWSFTLNVSEEQIKPQYEYAYFHEGQSLQSFRAREVSLGFRYAFAERSAPLFGRYYSTGTKYPKLYGRLTAGSWESGSVQSTYFQALAAVSWRKHFNRIGREHFLVLAGKSWSDQPLPLSKLFAGNGFAFDEVAFYVFGGFLTMRPYDYYSDQFVSAFWKHDFDWHFYKPALSYPYLSIAHSYYQGTLSKQYAHKEVFFAVGSDGYHESGILVNNLLRFAYMNMFHINLNGGYFYHWEPTHNFQESGRFVVGVGVDL